MEMVKIQMQIAGVSASPSRAPASAAASLAFAAASAAPARPSAIAVVRSLGLGGLYRHTGATLARDVPFSLLFFSAHAGLKEMGPKDVNGVPTFSAVFWGGVLAGALAAATVTPMDGDDVRW